MCCKKATLTRFKCNWDYQPSLILHDGTLVTLGNGSVEQHMDMNIDKILSRVFARAEPRGKAVVGTEIPYTSVRPVFPQTVGYISSELDERQVGAPAEKDRCSGS